MALIPKITKITLIILIVFLLSAIVTPVSADATILTHKDKRNLDIPDYFVPIKNFDMNPYLTPSSFINDILLKQCFRDDTCWKSLDAKTQSNVYKTIVMDKKPQELKPTDKNRDSICNTTMNCNLDKKGWVGTESLTSGILHLSYDNTQPNKISVKTSYEPQKIKLYGKMYSFKIYDKPSEIILLKKTFNLNNLSDDERKTIDLIVNIIDTGNQNNTLGLILSIIGTGIGATSTTITCAATVPTLGASSMA